MRSIEEWILAATGHIRFPPDRKAVAEEIRASYEDHRPRRDQQYAALCLSSSDHLPVADQSGRAHLSIDDSYDRRDPLDTESRLVADERSGGSAPEHHGVLQGNG